ncbi:Hypothetical protein LCAKO_2390 [Lacticaseibacillus paracasei subsp. paracasei]|uniref:Uncharacterized protein n=1 Tax=Lacticaseibacillus paracasei subsp. paracasei TaxID=47714 RepID=A0AAP9HJV5_LACPA|nr:Hypothetical protein LCAKO_2390 [Lacticaseibacillus paracasei subsp. paracasei]
MSQVDVESISSRAFYSVHVDISKSQVDVESISSRAMNFMT